jgi:uncharacterized phage-associated protein
MHDANLIANEFLDLAAKNGDTLTPMQLLKLVYIAHGWMLGLYGVPLVADEIQAWKYGPVIPRLYECVKNFRSNPVKGPLSVTPSHDELIDLEKNLIDQVYEKYGHMNGIYLSNLTHKSGTPWALTYKEGSQGIAISNDVIEAHYSQLTQAA